MNSFNMVEDRYDVRSLLEFPFCFICFARKGSNSYKSSERPRKFQLLEDLIVSFPLKNDNPSGGKNFVTATT